MGRVPVIGPGLRSASRWLKQTNRRIRFPGSAAYWERRYSEGGNSGPGSSGELARFKADTLNAFVRQHGIRSVIELGCGDGSQLGLAEYPEYLGFDVSRQAIALCRRRFGNDATKRFGLMDEYAGETADLALSLDVVFHLVEDAVFVAYMTTLFAAASRFVVVYSSNRDASEMRDPQPHVRHRRFTDWVDAHVSGWTLSQHVPNRLPHRGDARTGSFADFFVYARE